MRLMGNEEALEILRSSRGSPLLERLLVSADLSLEGVTITVDQHVHGSPARKGVRIGPADPRGWVRLFVQAGDNNSCVSARLRYPSGQNVDYALVRAKLAAAALAIKAD